MFFLYLVTRPTKRMTTYQETTYSISPPYDTDIYIDFAGLYPVSMLRFSYGQLFEEETRRCIACIATTDTPIDFEGLECCVCLDPLGPSSSISLRQCRHTFHRDCIEKWVETSEQKVCPLCRKEIEFTSS